MKSDYRMISHVRTDKGWQPLPFPPKVKMYPEDAAAKNRHFDEHGKRLVPNSEYEKYLQNARLLN